MDELAEECRQAFSDLVGRELSIEEAREFRDTYMKYLGLVAPLFHDSEDGPRSVPARRRA